MGNQYQAMVIGAGPGGYVAAIRLAQLGVKTAIVDKSALGGTCLNVGCIPSKALITASKNYDRVKNSEKMGIKVGDVELDMGVLQKWKGSVVKRLTTGVASLLKGNGIDVYHGLARFIDPHTVEIHSNDGSMETVKSDSFVIATGSSPARVPGFDFDEKDILSSTGALDLKKVPKTLLVIGGGYIGLEIGTLYAKFGTKVTIVEMLDSLLPGFDPELTQVIERKLKRNKVAIHKNSKALEWSKKTKVKISVGLDLSGKHETIEFEKILVTVGRRPNTEGLDLTRVGVQIDERGFIGVDNQLRTNVPSIFAIGDVVGDPMLAHKASKEAEVVAEVIAGKNVILDYRAMPAVVFTDPEIATVGLMEHEAKAKGLDVKIGKYNFIGLGRALTTDSPEGFVKVIADANTHEILGVSVVGAEASELVAEAGLAMEFGADIEDIGLTVHAHPTLAEALPEAARDVVGEAIHALTK